MMTHTVAWAAENTRSPESRAQRSPNMILYNVTYETE